MQQIPEPKWLTIKQAAEAWGLHPNTIRNLITRGQLKVSRLGRNIIRIDANDLNALFTAYEGGVYGVWSK